jgi:hypothetical protein
VRGCRGSWWWEERWELWWTEGKEVRGEGEVGGGKEVSRGEGRGEGGRKWGGGEGRRGEGRGGERETIKDLER